MGDIKRGVKRGWRSVRKGWDDVVEGSRQLGEGIGLGKWIESDKTEGKKRRVQAEVDKANRPIPLPDEEELERLRRRKGKGSGRASTVLTEDERLGG